METKRNENWSTSQYKMSFCPSFAGIKFIFFLGIGTVLYQNIGLIILIISPIFWTYYENNTDKTLIL